MQVARTPDVRFVGSDPQGRRLQLEHLMTMVRGADRMWEVQEEEDE